MVEVHVRTRVFVAVQQCCSAVVDLERSLGLVQLHFAGLVATAVIVLVAGLALVLTCRVGLRLVEGGQSCVVSQPQTVATFVDMQRDETIH